MNTQPNSDQPIPKDPDTKTSQATQAEEAALNQPDINIGSNSDNRCAGVQNSTSPLFSIPDSPTLFCGDNFQTILGLANELWSTLVHEATNWLVVFDIANEAGLKISFEGPNPDYGWIVLRSSMCPLITVSTDTVIQQLEGTTEVNVQFDNMSGAVAWTCDLLRRIECINKYWSDGEVFWAAKNRYDRINGGLLRD